MHLNDLLLWGGVFLLTMCRHGTQAACFFLFRDNRDREVFRVTRSGCYNVDAISTASFQGSDFEFVGLSTDTRCGNALVFQAARVGDGGFVIGGIGGRSSDIHRTRSFDLKC